MIIILSGLSLQLDYWLLEYGLPQNARQTTPIFQVVLLAQVNSILTVMECLTLLCQGAVYQNL